MFVVAYPHELLLDESGDSLDVSLGFQLFLSFGFLEKHGWSHGFFQRLADSFH